MKHVLIVFKSVVRLHWAFTFVTTADKKLLLVMWRMPLCLKEKNKFIKLIIAEALYNNACNVFITNDNDIASFYMCIRQFPKTWVF